MSRQVTRSPALIAAELWNAGGAEEATVLPHAQRSGAKHVGLQSLLSEAVRWQSRIAYRQEHLANRHAELEGGEDEGGCTSDLGVAAGGWVVFEDEARVHVDGERIADSEGQVAEKVNGYKQEREQQRQRHLRYMDSQNASKWQLIDGSALSCVRKIN
jgi:hypothetical protein